MTDEILFGLIRDSREPFKSPSEMITAFMNSFRTIPTKNVEELNRLGSENVPDWKPLTPLSAEEQKKRADLREKLTRKLLEKNVSRSFSDHPSTNSRFPEELIMHRIAPPGKKTLTEDEKRYNAAVANAFNHPKENMSTCVECLGGLAKRTEKLFGELMSIDLSDEEMVNRANDILDVHAFLSQDENMMRPLEECGLVTREINPLDPHGQKVPKINQEVFDTLHPDQQEDLKQFLETCQKYTKYATYFGAAAHHIGAIQNPYYSVFDINSPEAKANFTNPNTLAMPDEVCPGKFGYDKQGPLYDLASGLSTEHLMAVNSQGEIIKQFFRSKGIHKEDLVYKENGAGEPIPFAKNDFDIKNSGFAVVFAKDNPEEILIFRFDGIPHLARQLLGIESTAERPQPGDEELKKSEPTEPTLKNPTAPTPPKEPKVPALPTVPKPEQPNWFKRLFHAVFNAFSDEFTAYETNRARYEEDQMRFLDETRLHAHQSAVYSAQMREYNKQLEQYKEDSKAYNAQDKVYQEELSKKADAFERKSNEAISDYQQTLTGKKDAKVINVRERMKENLDIMLKESSPQAAINAAYLEIEVCRVFIVVTEKILITEKEFNMMKKQMGEELKSKVPEGQSLDAYIQEKAAQEIVNSGDSKAPAKQDKQKTDAPVTHPKVTVKKPKAAKV